MDRDAPLYLLGIILSGQLLVVAVYFLEGDETRGLFDAIGRSLAALNFLLIGVFMWRGVLT